MLHPNNKCKVCGKPTKLTSKYYGYRKTCSPECQSINCSRQSTKNRKYSALNFGSGNRKEL